MERAVPLVVEVSKDGNVWDEIWATTEAQAEWSFTLKKPVPARYVRIRKANKGFLHLRRAMIYSAP
jgi:hypothetical protein